MVGKRSCFQSTIRLVTDAASSHWEKNLVGVTFPLKHVYTVATTCEVRKSMDCVWIHIKKRRDDDATVVWHPSRVIQWGKPTPMCTFCMYVQRTRMYTSKFIVETREWVEFGIWNLVYPKISIPRGLCVPILGNCTKQTSLLSGTIDISVCSGFWVTLEFTTGYVYTPCNWGSVIPRTDP